MEYLQYALSWKYIFILQYENLKGYYKLYANKFNSAYEKKHNFQKNINCQNYLGRDRQSESS